MAMKVFRTAAEVRPGGRPVCVAIGVFDGVHLGHQQVIRQTLTDAGLHEALAVVITFDRHPNSVVAPDRVPPLIYSLPQKLRTIASLGVDGTWLIPFDADFSRQTGDAFIRELAREVGHLHSVCVGSEFTFGWKRSGNVALLTKLGAELGFVVHGLSAVALDGQVVSSTRVREAIRTGQLDAAAQMLGRGYSFAGEVIEGRRIGRQLGFPTANLDTRGLVLPPAGVYAAHAFTLGRVFRAAVNIGLRPTLADPTPSVQVEAHLLDFSEDLYGREVELGLVARLRAEQKFGSREELRSQIARDVQSARDLFNRPSKAGGERVPGTLPRP